MDLQRFNEGLVELQEVSKKLEEFRNDKVKELSVIDSEICDIYHYIENFSYNAVQGAKLLKLLKQTLKRRRVVKDEIEAITSVVLSLSDNTKNYIKKSKKAIKKIEGKRTYNFRTRIIQDTFGITGSKMTTKPNDK